MPYQPIENYGIIGNMRTVALIAMHRSIDWYCYPHFDSPSIFGALLDDDKGGRFQIQVVVQDISHNQRQLQATNILLMNILLRDGIKDLEDFFAVGLAKKSSWYHHFYNRFRCDKGCVLFSRTCRPSFNYGHQSHETALETS